MWCETEAISLQNGRRNDQCYLSIYVKWLQFYSEFILPKIATFIGTENLFRKHYSTWGHNFSGKPSKDTAGKPEDIREDRMKITFSEVTRSWPPPKAIQGTFLVLLVSVGKAFTNFRGTKFCHSCWKERRTVRKKDWKESWKWPILVWKAEWQSAKDHLKIRNFKNVGRR